MRLPLVTRAKDDRQLKFGQVWHDKWKAGEDTARELRAALVAAYRRLSICEQRRDARGRFRKADAPRLVIVESPFAGDVEANVDYARRCVRDALSRGEAPIASHLLYTQPGILNDDNPAERTWGIDAGLAWGRNADATVVYTDRGISTGMEYGVSRAREDGRPVEYRTLAAPKESRTI